MSPFNCNPEFIAHVVIRHTRMVVLIVFSATIVIVSSVAAYVAVRAAWHGAQLILKAVGI
jgi:hypothetical protein